jgi:hypothetical protein
MIENMKKPGKEVTFLSILKVIYEKPLVNIILNGEKLKSFFSKTRNKAKVSSLPTIFSIVLEFLARTIKKGERSKNSSNMEGRSQIISIRR